MIDQKKLQQLHARLEGSNPGLVTRRDLRDLVACFIEEEQTCSCPLSKPSATCRVHGAATGVDAAVEPDVQRIYERLVDMGITPEHVLAGMRGLTAVTSERDAARAEVERLCIDRQADWKRVEQHNMKLESEIARLRAENKELSNGAWQLARADWDSLKDKIKAREMTIAEAHRLFGEIMADESNQRVGSLSQEGLSLTGRLRAEAKPATDVDAAVDVLMGAFDVLSPGDHAVAVVVDELERLRFELARLRAIIAAAPPDIDVELTLRQQAEEIARLRAEQAARESDAIEAHHDAYDAGYAKALSLRAEAKTEQAGREVWTARYDNGRYVNGSGYECDYEFAVCFTTKMAMREFARSHRIDNKVTVLTLAEVSP